MLTAVARSFMLSKPLRILMLAVVVIVLSVNLFTSVLVAQVADTTRVLSQDVLANLNASRIQINKLGMLTLGLWAVSNMAVNGALMTRSEGNAYYFQQMNVFWNVVNLGLAAAGYWGAVQEQPSAISLAETVQKQSSIESILLLNAGLDVAYMAGGAWMLEHSKTSADAERWRGYGQSLLLQGGFLLVFDVAMYVLHHAQGSPALEQILRSVQIGANPYGYSVALRLYF
jgi:hypothetical protein